MAISSCFVEDADHGPHIVKSSHSLVGEREKKICILYGKTNQMKERIATKKVYLFGKES